MASVALGQKAVGSVVKLKFNGAMREFLVVHQGRPSTLYDASCDGVWLLMKDCLEAKRWHSSDVNDYANSEVNSYLNSTVLSKFDKDIQAQIKQVKIPYRPGSGTSGTVNSGANGLSTKIFLLSDREVGYTKSNVNSYICDDGAKLAYFQDGNGTSEKIAKFNGSAVYWWLRSPYLSHSTNAWLVISNGSANLSYCSYTGYYLRPALILSSNLLISIEDEEEQGGGKTEAETYAEYCAYVEEWAEYANDGGQDQGTSPLTYEEWKEENAERVEAE